MTEGRARIAEFGPQRFRRYPDYRDSGVEWLGEIPAHWDMKRLKFVSHIVAGQSPPSEAVVDSMDGLSFLQGNAEFGPMNPTPHQVCDSAPKRAEPGDILLSVRAPVGAMNMADRHYGIGRGLCAIRPTAGLGRLFSFYEVMTMRPLLDAVATGSTYDAVTASDVGDLPMLLPGRDEQRAIAAFLERETVKIDALVAKKERLIELLREKRTALITRAVTRGLDASVPMKDSGVEWLGEIPARWKTTPAGRVVHGIEQGWSPVAEDRPAARDEWGVIKLSAVSAGNFREAEHKTLPSGVSPDARYEIREKDFLLTRSNTPDLVGDVCVVGVVRSQLMLCDLVYRLNVMHDRVDRRFLAYWFLGRAGRHQIEVDARGSSRSMVKVSQGIIRAWTVAMPPLEEQAEIVTFLDRETANIDALITRVREAVVYLKEYRTALISASVTGKIDVRDEAA